MRFHVNWLKVKLIFKTRKHSLKLTNMTITVLYNDNDKSN